MPLVGILSSPLGLVVDILFFLVAALLFFLPTIIAVKRGTTKLVVVVLVNILLGGTGIGWLAALVLSLALPRKQGY
jgi:hypothetical protein